MKGTVSLEFVLPFLGIILFIETFINYYNIPVIISDSIINIDSIIPYFIFFIGIYSIIYLSRFIPKNGVGLIHYQASTIVEENLSCDNCFSKNIVCQECKKIIDSGEVTCGNNSTHICGECWKKVWRPII